MKAFIPKIMKSYAFESHLDELSFCGAGMDSVLGKSIRLLFFSSAPFLFLFKNIFSAKKFIKSQLKN